MSRLLSRPQTLQEAPVHEQSGLVVGLARAGRAISRTGTQIADVARSFRPSAPRNHLQRDPASGPVDLPRPLNATPGKQGRDGAFYDMYLSGYSGIEEVQEAELLEETGLNGLYRGPRSYNRRWSGYEF